MKGAIAAMMLVGHGRYARSGSGAGAAGHRRRRGVRGGGRAGQRLFGGRAGSSGTLRSRGSRPIFISALRPRECWRCGSRWREGRPWSHALARRQRRSQRDRCFSQYRVATVRPAQFGVVRPPLDQPGRDLGGGRAEQGARPMRDRRRHPLSARPGPRCVPGAGQGHARGRGRRRFAAAAGGGRPRLGLCAGAARRGGGHHDGEPMSVGRDGASDAVSFLRVGVPAVEFGPVGAGHHGPEEWVSVSSLETYRQALESFLRSLPERSVSSAAAAGRAGRPASRPRGRRRAAAEEEALLVALRPRRGDHRRRLRRGDLGQHPALHRQHRRRAQDPQSQTHSRSRPAARTSPRRRAGDDPDPRLRHPRQSAEDPGAPTRRSCSASIRNRT